MTHNPEVPKGTLFVTGGSFGIGKEVLDRFGERYRLTHNFDVAQSPDRDVRDYSAVQKTVSETMSPDLQNDLVICAGVFRPVDFLYQTQADIDFVLDVNLRGALYTTQAFLRWHQEQPHPVTPNIVLVSSISAFFHGGVTNVVYDATKSALSYMVKNLANFNCVVNAVEPGTIRETQIGSWNTDFSKDESSKRLVDQSQAKDVERLGREVTKEEVADVIDTLLFNNRTGAINGTTITVDGGFTALRERF